MANEKAKELKPEVVKDQKPKAPPVEKKQSESLVGAHRKFDKFKKETSHHDK